MMYKSEAVLKNPEAAKQEFYRQEVARYKKEKAEI